MQTVSGKGIHSGRELTNLQPMCDGSDGVHEAMKSKVEPAICGPLPSCCIPSTISGSFFAYLAAESQMASLQQVNEIHQSAILSSERQISGAVWARS